MRLSGVVTRTSGGFSRCFALRELGVSPMRSSTRHGTPRAPSASVSASVVSRESARSGVIQSARIGPGSRSPARSASSRAPSQTA